MNNYKAKRYLRALFYSARILSSGHEYVFILSHMRSYSSLLSHILGSHPEILGYSERHESYRWYGDLLRMRIHVSSTVPGHQPRRYILDKILHNEHSLSNAILQRPTVKLVFLIRSPADTLRSIINMGNSMIGISWYTDPLKVVQYYSDRLNRLIDIASKRQAGALFVKAEDIINRTTVTLGSITQYLDLNTPIDPEYNVFKFTGQPGYGDPSDNIKQGRILPGTDTKYPKIAIPEAYMEMAQQAYENCNKQLEKMCILA